MKFFFITSILAVGIFLQTTLFSLPFVLLSLLLFTILFEEEWVFIAAFFAGLVLDMLSLKTIGMSSLFFTITLGVVFLYKRKYEIQSLPFVAIFTTIASVIYLALSGNSFPIPQAFVSGILAGGVFFLISKLSHITLIGKNRNKLLYK